MYGTLLLKKKVKIVTKRISKCEIEKLYKKWNTPDRVKAHCKAVSDVGVKLAEELNKHGYSLDLELIKAAGLIHDVARIYENHDEIGYRILVELGYEDEAAIVRVHMKYPKFNDVEHLDECDIVCLADRVVKEDKYVGLDERIDYIIHKIPDGNPEVVERILSKKEDTRKILEQIAQIIGKTLDELFIDDVH